MTTCTDTTRPLRAPFGQPAEPLRCTRPAGHLGQHQAIEHVPERLGDPTAAYDFQRKDYPAFDSLTTWGQGGGSSTTYGSPEDLAANCTTCQRAAKGLSRYGTPHDPSEHAWVECVHCGITYHNLGHSRLNQHPETRDGWCFHCAEWMSRALRYAEPDTSLVRVRPGERLQPDRLYSWSKVTGAFGGWHVSVTWDDGRTAGPRDSLWDAGAIPAEWLDYFPPNATVTPGEKIARAGHTDRFGKPLTYTGHP